MDEHAPETHNWNRLMHVEGSWINSYIMSEKNDESSHQCNERELTFMYRRCSFKKHYTAYHKHCLVRHQNRTTCKVKPIIGFDLSGLDTFLKITGIKLCSNVKAEVMHIFQRHWKHARKQRENRDSGKCFRNQTLFMFDKRWHCPGETQRLEYVMGDGCMTA